MKLVRWSRFTWNLSKIPPLNTVSVPAHYNVRPATRDEVKQVKEVISSAFSLDSAWSGTFRTFKDSLEAQLDLAFSHDAIPALVVTHGQRIIGASGLDSDIDAESHLTSGPAVSIEYRNRGLGTALLLHSLHQLKHGGLDWVHGICKENSAMSKFVYPKFGSVAGAYDLSTSVLSP